MTKSIIKSIVVGTLLGAAAFFMPKIILGIIAIGIIFRVFHGCCGGAQHRFYRLDKIRLMSDEEYSEFKNGFGKNCCSSHSRCCNTASK